MIPKRRTLSGQVFGVTAEDHTIVIRTGVTETELTGKTWKSICLPLGLRSPSPTPSPSPNSSPSPSPSPKSKTARLSDSVANTMKDRSQISATTYAVQNKESVSLPGYNKDSEELMRVEKELGCMSLRESTERESESEEKSSNTEEQMEKDSPLDDSIGIKIQYPEDFPSSLSSSGISETSNHEQSRERRINTGHVVQEDSKNSSVVMSEVNPPEEDHQNSARGDPNNHSTATTDQTLQQLPKALTTQSSLEWSESRLRHISSSSGGSEPGQCRGMSMVVPREDDGPAFPVLPLPADHLWLWVTGGGCWIQASNMPKW